MLHSRNALPQDVATIEDGFLPASSTPWGPGGREAKIASAIVEVAHAEAACLGGARLLRIGVNVGADCDIDISSLNDALRVTCKGTDMEHVTFHLILRPRRNFCHHCGCEFTSSCMVADCPRCASSDLELVGGDDLEISFIEVERA